ncbi:hypothetical protein PHMEG_00026801, partial [Phytophthora megakarya]
LEGPQDYSRGFFKRKIVEYNASLERLKAFLLLSDPEETPLTQTLRVRIREVVAENKRLQKTAPSLRSWIRLDEMDPETLICILEGLEAEELDWEVIEPNPLTRKALRQVFKFDELQAQNHRMAVAQAATEGKPEQPPSLVFESGDDCSAGEESKVSSPPAATSSSSRAASTSSSSATPSQRQASGKSRKRKATRSQHGDDDQDVDLGDGSDVVGVAAGRECSPTPSFASAGSSQLKKQRVLYLPHDWLDYSRGRYSSVFKNPSLVWPQAFCINDVFCKIQVQSSVDASAESDGSFRVPVISLQSSCDAGALDSSLSTPVITINDPSNSDSDFDADSDPPASDDDAAEDEDKELTKHKPETECLDGHDDSDSSAEDYPPVAAPTKSPAPVEAKVPLPKPLPATSEKKSQPKPKKTPDMKAEIPAVKIHPRKARVIFHGSSVGISGLPSLILGKPVLVQLFKRSTTNLRSYVVPAFSRPGVLA